MIYKDSKRVASNRRIGGRARLHRGSYSGSGSGSSGSAYFDTHGLATGSSTVVSIISSGAPGVDEGSGSADGLGTAMSIWTGYWYPTGSADGVATADVAAWTAYTDQSGSADGVGAASSSYAATGAQTGSAAGAGTGAVASWTGYWYPTGTVAGAATAASSYEAKLVTFSAGTFTRSTEASYYTAAPNTTGSFLAWAGVDTLREDKRDGVSGLYLFEPLRQNLCFYSEALDDASWTKTGASVGAGTTTAPDGGNDCKTITFTASATDKISRTVAGTTNAVNYALTAWVRKAAGAGNIRLRVIDRNAATTTSADLAIGTTWTRIEYIVAWGTGASTPEVHILNDAAGTAQDVEVWGVQVESLSGTDLCSTSYVRTTGAVGTKQADRLVYTSYPDLMRTGKWHIKISPSGTSTEHLVTSTICSFATVQRDQAILLSTEIPQLRIASTSQYAAATATWSRDQVLDLTFDMAGATATTSGATTGNGAGAQGVIPTFSSTSHLSFGSSLTGNVDFSNARVGEPYYVVPSTPFDFDSISGLVVDLDARDLSAGAITSWIDRKNGYDFAGTATAGTDINGMPTVTANGTSDILTSTAAIAGINGASAVTIVGVYKDAYATAVNVIILEHGNDSTSVTDAFSLNCTSTGGRFDAYLKGNGAVSAGRSEHYISETLATARVLTSQMDKSLSTGESALIRRDGTAVGATSAFNSDNTNTFGSYAINLFARNGGSLYWPGSIAKLVIYNRALTAGEMSSVERACGLITRILVA